MVNEVLSLEELSGWDSRYEILSIRLLFSFNPDWILHWVPREANSCADIAAKWAKSVKSSVVVFDHFVDFLLVSVLNYFAEDRTFRSLQL